MHAFLLTIAAAALGVDAGWTPIEGGKHEYIIQIEPQQLDTLRQGKDLTSNVPPGLNIACYRITVGTGQLPRELGTPAAASPVANARAGTAAEIAEGAAPAAQPTPSEAADAFGGSPGAPTTAKSDRSPAAADTWPEVPDQKTAAEQKSREGQPSDLPQRDSLPFSFPGADKAPTDPSKERPSAESPFSAAASVPAADPTLQDRSTAGAEPAAATPGTTGEDSASVQPALDPAAKVSNPFRGGSADNRPEVAEKRGGSEFEPPRPFSDNNVQPAVAHRPESSSGGVPAAATGNNAAPPPAKPWTAFVLTLFALCVSLGGNAYMGWVTWFARMRYRNLVEDLRGTAASSA